MSHSPLYLVAGLALALLIYSFIRVRKRHPPAATPFADFPVYMAKVGTWQIRYHISGRGPYMVLLHGLGANLFCWRWIVPLLATRYTVVALDLPGFGASSKLAGAHYGLDDQVKRLGDFLNELGIKKAYFVGNSMGGNIALWFALNFPERCLGLAVIAPATSSRLIPLSAKPWLWLSHPIAMTVGRRAMGWAHRRTVSKKDRVDRDRIEETYQTYGQNAEAVRSFLAATETIRDPRLAERLGEIKSPVLVLWGSEDQLVKRHVIEDLEAALAAKESYVHIGGGHHLQEDEPEWVAQKIDAFFGTSLD